jgi:hypothetical protein
MKIFDLQLQRDQAAAQAQRAQRRLADLFTHLQEPYPTQQAQQQQQQQQHPGSPRGRVAQGRQDQRVATREQELAQTVKALKEELEKWVGACLPCVLRWLSVMRRCFPRLLPIPLPVLH